MRKKLDKKNKMDKRIKEKWIKALKSGRYKQTEGTLKDNDGYCCLGVLCNVINRRKWKRIVDGFNEEYTYDGADGTLPKHLRESCGITRTDESHLIGLNDTEGYNFKQIAQYIEENL